MEPHPALVRAQQVAVLDPVAAEHPVGPVVHEDREVDDDLVLGLREDRPEVVGEVDDLGATVELVQGCGEEAGAGVGHRGPLGSGEDRS